jgi:hypothetical protein
MLLPAVFESVAAAVAAALVAMATVNAGNAFFV